MKKHYKKDLILFSSKKMFSYKKSIGALIGNVMQFYDFTIYAFLAPQISQEFFNFKNPFLSYLVVFSVFSGGYFTRPIGSLLFGHLGDKNGRSHALSKTILIATIATFLIGIIPGYKSIGIISPLILVVLRLLQGLAVSGEEGGAVVLLFEKYAFKNKGMIGSTVLSSVLVGVILGALVCAVTSQLMLRQLIGDWGWRIPFLLSLPLGVIATVMRFYLNDFKLFDLAKKQNLLVHKPIMVLFRSHLWAIIFSVSVVSVYSVLTSTLIVHLPYFLTMKTGFSHDASLIVLAISISFVAILTPFFGRMCDTLDPFIIYNGSLLGMIFLSPFIFYLFSLNNAIYIFSGILFFSIITSLISSSIFSILVGLFPFGVRYSGVSLSFNVSVTIFSSSTPVVLVLIENYFDTPLAPGLYISVLGLICMLATVLLRKKLTENSFNNKEIEEILY